MKIKLILLLIMFFSLPAFCAVESKPIIKKINIEGFGITQYGTREDNEYSLSKFKYDTTTLRGNNVFTRKAGLISRPCRDMASNGIVYEEPNCRIQEDGSHFQSLIAWIQEDYGTFTEVDIRWIIEPIRLYVYAVNSDNLVVKYKIIEKKQDNFIKQKLYGNYEIYEPISYFIQTKIGKKSENQGYKFDKNGRMLPFEEQKEFSEIVEYTMDGQILSIYRKNKYDRIDEFNADGKTLKSHHDTSYIPYLQWTENKNKNVFKTIEKFKPIN